MRNFLTADLLSQNSEPKWVIKDLLPQNSLVILHGISGMGKSSLSYYLAMCVASGHPFLGRETPQGKVLYFDQENNIHDWLSYAQKAWHGIGRPNVTDTFIHEHRTLGRREWLDIMLTYAIELQPSLIVIDTAVSALHTEDENNNAEASRTINSLYQVQQAAAPGCSLLILKHSLDSLDSRKVRGAKAWVSATDQTIALVASPGRPSNTPRWKPKRLVPDKVRAWGLHEDIVVIPEETPDKLGIIFRSEVLRK